MRETFSGTIFMNDPEKLRAPDEQLAHILFRYMGIENG
jgi:hypothetical protein